MIKRVRVKEVSGSQRKKSLLCTPRGEGRVLEERELGEWRVKNRSWRGLRSEKEYLVPRQMIKWVRVK